MSTTNLAVERFSLGPPFPALENSPDDQWHRIGENGGRRTLWIPKSFSSELIRQCCIHLRASEALYQTAVNLWDGEELVLGQRNKVPDLSAPVPGEIIIHTVEELPGALASASAAWHMLSCVMSVKVIPGCTSPFEAKLRPEPGTWSP
jgi:hypothetical protein